MIIRAGILVLVLIVSTPGFACSQRTWEVNGVSLSPLIPHGAEVHAKPIDCAGYFTYGDLLIIKNGGNQNPLIKIIKALPGDKFSLKVVDSTGIRHLYVQGKPVVNSTGEPYRINDRRAGMLSLYIEDYDGIIPENTFLIFGDNLNGTVDSSTFGLVHVRDVVGMVQLDR